MYSWPTNKLTISEISKTCSESLPKFNQLVSQSLVYNLPAFPNFVLKIHPQLSSELRCSQTDRRKQTAIETGPPPEVAEVINEEQVRTWAEH